MSTLALKPTIADHLQQVLPHLYINPLEKCNLKCKICYTRKTSPVLSNQQIEEFVTRYQTTQPVQSITFCGGEVFALTTFTRLINALTKQGIIVQVITNGTIDRLDEIENPNMVNLITSLDGLEKDHDDNRGEGNFRKSITFMKKAHRLGFHVDVFSIVTRQNLSKIDAFEAGLLKELGFMPEITYHPRKPPSYLTIHPVSNIVGETDGFDFLTPAEMLLLMKTKNVFPPAQLGCYQISLMSDGRVFGCCEGVTPLGRIEDEPTSLIDQLTTRIEKWSLTETNNGHCLGCSQPEFMCGIKQYIMELSHDKS